MGRKGTVDGTLAASRAAVRPELMLLTRMRPSFRKK